MAVSAPVMLRAAFAGGLASLGVCLVWVGVTLTEPKIKVSPPPILPSDEASVLPTIAPITLPPPAKPVIATVAQPPRAAAAGGRQFLHFKGDIHNSLFDSALAHGVPVAMLTEMIRAFSYDVDFQRDIQADDRFELMIERSGDKKPVYKLVTASLTLSGVPLTLIRYVDQQGNADYYTPSGESARKALLKTPVDGGKISSGFGRRFHPILHYTTQHKGIDFAVMTGTPVMAAGDGVVDYAGVNGAYGLYVRVKHDGTHATAYAHLSRLAAGVKPGKKVAQGQTIALSGSTGRSTGPHLHYEMLVDDEQVNPMSVKFQAGRKLAGKELSRFKAAERQVSAWLAETPPTTRMAMRGN